MLAVPNYFRKDHLLMNYAQKFDRLPIKEQEALAMLVNIRDHVKKTCIFNGRVR